MDANVRRIEKSGLTALTAGLKTKMRGVDTTNWDLYYKDSAGNMHAYVTKGGAGEYASLDLTNLTGSGSFLAVDDDGTVYKTDAPGSTWLEPVDSFYDPTSALPVAPTTGDRYVADHTGNGWAKNNIYEYDGVEWLETYILGDGYVAVFKDVDVIFIFNGANWVVASGTSEITGEPTGFRYPQSVVLTYDGTTRTIAISNYSECYFVGNRVTEIDNTFVSDPHDDVDGEHWLYYDGSDILWADTFPGMANLLIACVVKDGVTVCIRECHGLKMSADDHFVDHWNIGTFKLATGGDYSGYTLYLTTETERRPTTSAMVIYDEDLPTDIPQWLKSSGYTRGALVGTEFVLTNDNLDLIDNNGGTQPYFDINGGKQLVANNKYVTCLQVAIPASSGTACQKQRLVWVQPQAEFSTLAEAEAIISLQDVDLAQIGDLVPEMVVVGQAIFRYTANNFSLQRLNKVYGSRYKQATSAGAAGLTSVSVDGTTIIGSGIPLDPIQSGIWNQFNDPLVDGYFGFGYADGARSLAIAHAKPTFNGVPIASGYACDYLVLGQTTGGVGTPYLTSDGYIFSFTNSDTGDSYLGFGPGVGGGGGYSFYIKQPSGPTSPTLYGAGFVQLQGTTYSYDIRGGDTTDLTKYKYLGIDRIEDGVTIGTITYPVAGSDYFKFDKPLKVYSSATQNATHNALSSVWLDGANDCTITPVGVTLSAVGAAYIGFSKNGIDSYIDANNSMTLIGSEGTPGLSIKKAGVLGTIDFPITGDDYFNFNKTINLPSGKAYQINGVNMVKTVATDNYLFGETLNTTISGTKNLLIGYEAGTKLTSATYNIAIGYKSLANNLTANFNTGIGYLAFYNLTTGTGNFAMGVDAGRYYATSSSLVSATDCIFIGTNARAAANAPTKEIAIGSNSLGKGTDTSVIGDTTAVGFYGYGIHYMYARTAPTVGVTGFNGVYCSSADDLLYSIGEGNAIYALNAIEKKFGALGFVTPPDPINTLDATTYRQFFPSESCSCVDNRAGDGVRFGYNFYRNLDGASGTYRYRNDDFISYIYFGSGGEFRVYTAPTGLKDAAATVNDVFAVRNGGEIWSENRATTPTTPTSGSIEYSVAGERWAMGDNGYEVRLT